MRLKHRRTIAITVVLIAAFGFVALWFRPPAGRTFSLRWEGWRYAKVTLKPLPLYVADTNGLADEYRYVQLGPVRVFEGPIDGALNRR